MNLKSNIYRFYRKVIEEPVLTSIVVFIVVSSIVILFSYKEYSSDFWLNVKVEAHGMLFDILVIGVLVLWLNQKGAERREIQRYKEEIDDFRNWENPEAAHKIRGSIIRLNKRNFGAINLQSCYLNRTDLVSINLKNANLSQASLKDADLTKANLSNANLTEAKLAGANLTEAVLVEADLTRGNLIKACLNGANLNKASLWEANLSEANLLETNLGKANIMDVNLTGANLWGADLRDAKLWETEIKEADFTRARLTGVRGLNINHLSQAKTFYKAILDPEIEKQINDMYPHLLADPEKNTKK